MGADPSPGDCAAPLIVGALIIVFRRYLSRGMAEAREILDPDHFVPALWIAGVGSILIGAAIGLVWIVG